MCVGVFDQWLHEYCPLKYQLSLACRRNTYFWRAQYSECRFGCVVLCAILLKPNVANILFFNFCEQKLVQQDPITIAIDCNGFSLLIFEEKWPNYASGPKSAPNTNSFRVHRLFIICVRVDNFACYIPAKIKMSFIWKDDFFLPKSASFISRP